jgi:NodT family efflux transporter outer membrane factor (OMF) lipoprotein
MKIAKLMHTHFGKILFVMALAAICAGCNFAPRYKTPAVETPATFKENSGTNDIDTNIWQVAQPNDAVIRSNWWEIFNDPALNTLEGQVAVSNQNVVAAFENFLSAHAQVREAQAEYFPTASANPSVTRTRISSGGFSIRSSNPNVTEYETPLDASWQPDFWGKIRNTVRASKGSAQASAADLENTKLSAQAELASDYFQLQGQDSLIRLFDDTVNAYSNSLKLTQVLFKTGIDSDQDVAQAETQLETTEAQGTNLRILRAQLEHAIAVLLGRPPATFSIPRSPLIARPPNIPVALPAQLLERRPDIAEAERAVFSTSAQIGVARAAFFPNVTLSASGGYEDPMIDNLFQWGNRIWSLGATASQPLFNAALPPALAQYKAEYLSDVATYRQTVLSAFQGVEDNLVALRVLKTQIQQQEVAVESSQKYLDLAIYRYKLGIDSYLNVITAQTTLLTNQQTLVDLYTQQMEDAVLLIEDLGGGWDVKQLPKY